MTELEFLSNQALVFNLTHASSASFSNTTHRFYEPKSVDKPFAEVCFAAGLAYSRVTSASAEADSGGLELDDGLEELERVGGEGGDGSCDQRDAGGLQVGGLPVSAI